MDYCDVLVVGGGPGGSTCARELAWHGLDVVVMDKRDFPRNKVCAGWITRAVVQSLKLDPDEYGSTRTLQPITGFRAAMMGQKAVESHYGEVMSYGLLRREFDDYLLRRCGARLRLGEAFKKAVRVGDRYRVNDSIETRLIVGAGGHFCPIARMLGAGEVSETVVTAQEIEFEMTESQARRCQVTPEIPELFFEPDLQGYGWCFRKRNHLNIGLGRISAQGLTERSHAFLRDYKDLGRIPTDIPDKFSGHAYILYGHTQRQKIGDGLLLIGDAAGLAYPASGEGIFTAIESGLLAARTIHAANGDYSSAKLSPYVDAIRKRYGRPQANYDLPAFVLPMIRWLFSVEWSARFIMDWAFKEHASPLIAQSSLVEPARHVPRAAASM